MFVRESEHCVKSYLIDVIADEERRREDSKVEEEEEEAVIVDG